MKGELLGAPIEPTGFESAQRATGRKKGDRDSWK